MPGKPDTYPNVAMVAILFTYENVGNLPVKDFESKPIGKLGNTTLPFTDPETGEKGIKLIQWGKVQNVSQLGRNEIVRLVDGKEKLVYTVDISYSDWEGYESFNYQTSFQVVVVFKEPLTLAILWTS
jgi:hypothetical protein